MTLYIEQFNSPNSEPRRDGKIPRFLILHYTEKDADWTHDRFMSGEAAQEGGRVSAHYVVLENGHVRQYVHEHARAWHAGVSYWAGETDLNSASIGIEIVNGGAAAGYPPYPPAQIAAVIALCRDILHRHPDILPAHVLAHSDIAPGRKFDPGPAFPWGQLGAAGIGIYPHPQAESLKAMSAADFDRALIVWGYSPDVTPEIRAQAFGLRYGAFPPVNSAI